MTSEATARSPEVFSPRVAIVLFLVGVFAFSAFITLSSFAPDFMDGDDGRGHALSRSALGYAGIVKLSRLAGTHVTVSRGEPQQSAPLVVLTPESELTLADVERLAHTRALIVLPKWFAMPSFQRKGWVGQAMTMDLSQLSDLLKDVLPAAKFARERNPLKPDLSFATNAGTPGPAVLLRPGTIASFQTITAKDLEPVIKTKSGDILLGRLKRKDEPEIYILSDPDLLNTQGLADRGSAEAGLAILNALHTRGEPIAFDVTLNGLARTRNLIRLALEPPLLAATLSLAIVAALIAWSAATRSGPARRQGRAIALGKQTLTDNSAALIRLAGRDHTMAARYADMIRTVAAEETRVAQDGTETTAAELDRIAASRGVANGYSELAVAANAAQTAEAAVAAARKLHAWTGEMIRATH